MAFSKDIITSLSNQVIGFKLLWAFKIFLALLMPMEKFQSAFTTFHKPHTISKALQARTKFDKIPGQSNREPWPVERRFLPFDRLTSWSNRFDLCNSIFELGKFQNVLCILCNNIPLNLIHKLPSLILFLHRHLTYAHLHSWQKNTRDVDLRVVTLCPSTPGWRDPKSLTAALQLLYYKVTWYHAGAHYNIV